MLTQIVSEPECCAMMVLNWSGLVHGQLETLRPYIRLVVADELGHLHVGPYLMGQLVLELKQWAPVKLGKRNGPSHRTVASVRMQRASLAPRWQLL